MKVLLVHGSHDSREWTKTTGDRSVIRTFADAVVNLGHELVTGWDWSAAVGGIIPFTRADLNIWSVSGEVLANMVAPIRCRHCAIPGKDLAIIAWSHGRQPVRYALEAGLRAHTVIFVSGPIRRDVARETPRCYDRVSDRIVSLHGDWHDRWQIWGALFDGRLGIRRNDPHPQVTNVRYAGGHGDLIHDPPRFAEVLRYLPPAAGRPD